MANSAGMLFVVIIQFTPNVTSLFCSSFFIVVFIVYLEIEIKIPGVGEENFKCYILYVVFYKDFIG